MSVNLTKGGNTNLTKTTPGLSKIKVGLGWDTRVTDGADFDLDASVFLLKDDKIRSTSDFVFFNNKSGDNGAVVHQGDNLTGAGDGDDEVIDIDLLAVSSEITRLVVAVTIYQAEERNQNFGQVQKAYIRIVNTDDGVELARFDLSEDASTDTATIFGEVYRNGTDWKFKAVDQGCAGGLSAISTQFGV